MTRDYDITGGESRRKFLKRSAAVGAAATGIVGFGGTAAAQETVIENVTTTQAGNLLNVNVQLSDTVDVENVRVIVRNVSEVVSVEDVTVDVDIDLDDIQAANINNLVVIVQALGANNAVLDTARQTVRQ